MQFFLLIICTLVISCSSPSTKINRGSIQSFDISPDGTSILFTWDSGNKVHLFKSKINGHNPKQLFNSNNQISVYNARFSPSGEKIIFLVSVPKSLNSSIWIANNDGYDTRQITDTSGIKTEAIFSHNEKRIYFVQANEYGSYSPLVGRAAHDFDIYSLTLGENKIIKISDLKAYSLSRISEVDSNKLLLAMHTKNKGIFFYKENDEILNQILVTNDSLSHSSSYSNPIMIDENNIICVSYYVLKGIDLKTKKEKRILRSNGSQFNTIRYNEKLKRIFFQKKDNLNVIHSMNLDGSDLINIPITVKDY